MRVPASSANLGPGFDSFAIALPLLAEFDLRPARAWSVNVDDGGNAPENGNGVPTGDDNLFVVSARAAAAAAAETLGSYHVTQRSAIPVGRGLGSSAAAIVGGVVAANARLPAPRTPVKAMARRNFEVMDFDVRLARSMVNSFFSGK